LNQQHHDKLLTIYRAALAAANGHDRVAYYLTHHPFDTSVYVVAIGKAALAMAAGAHDILDEQIIKGLVITRHGYDVPALPASAPFTVIEAGHPTPDANSLKAGNALLEFIAATPQDAKLLFLISGGTSALVEVLPEGVTLDDLEKINHWLLGSGYPIANINAVRKAVSSIKGGRLAKQLEGRKTLQLLISDVQGDDPATIGSGLLVADELSKAIIQNLTLPEWISTIIKQPEPMSIKGDACFANIQTEIIARAADARQGASAKAKELGYEVFLHDEFIAGDVARAADYILDELSKNTHGLHIWSSEVTVQLPEHPGQGGRCQHLALAMAEKIKGRDDILLLAAGTDGTDGPSDDAGALVDGGTIERGAQEGLDARHCLEMANSGEYLAESGDLVSTGGTGTNVMDLILGLKIAALGNASF